MTDVLYAAEVRATDGRHGSVQSTDGRLEVPLSFPASIGGDDGPGTNPEQLFAAGFAACFHSAVKGSARDRGVRLVHSSVRCAVDLIGQIPGDVGLRVGLTVEFPPGFDHETARELVQLASTRCPYSKAVRGNIEVRLFVRIELLSDTHAEERETSAVAVPVLTPESESNVVQVDG